MSAARRAASSIGAACVMVTLSLGVGCDSKRNQSVGPQEPSSSAPVATTPSPRSSSSASPIAPEAAEKPSNGAMRSIARDELCVTEGSLTSAAGGRIGVTASKMRAVLSRTTSPAAELKLVYRGPTADAPALKSGEVRRQLGLKLRAQDACNLVYAMWRIEPKPGLVVQIKKNAGQRTSRECGNSGYSTVKPRSSKTPPALEPGSSHALRAELAGDGLRVTIDGDLVWEGNVGQDAMTFEGPVGVRSDGVTFDFELLAAASAEPHACVKGIEGD